MEVNELKIGNAIAPHEALEIHELVEFKNLCATKSATMAALVKDDELKGILEQDVTVTQGHIKQLQNLMQGAGAAFEEPSGNKSF
jgi:similar to spore coat protein